MKLDKIYEQAQAEDKIVAVVKFPYQKPEVVAIGKGLSPIQEVVNGSIDVVYLPDIEDIHGFCNDEGLLIGMEPNFYRPEWKDAIVGLLSFSVRAPTAAVKAFRASRSRQSRIISMQTA